jgi:hypothetical protein
MRAEYFDPPGFDLRTVQPLANRNTDLAIPAHEHEGIHEYSAMQVQGSDRISEKSLLNVYQ